MKTWAQILKECLWSRRMTACTLQREHGIQTMTSYRIMSGKQNPSMKTIRKMEAAFNVRFDLSKIQWLKKDKCTYYQEEISHLPTSNTQQTTAGSGMPACQRDYLIKQSEDSYGSRSN